MSAANLPLQSNADSTTKSGTSSTLARVAKYTIFRASLISLALAIGVFLAIFVINFGGFIDDIARDRIAWAMAFMSMDMQGVPAEEKFETLEQAQWAMEEAAGLHEPFIRRSVRWFWRGMTFDWGDTGRTSRAALQTILERFPNTLLLVGSANLVLFFTTVSLALSLSKKHGSWLDKLLITLSPISSVPNWILGMLLTVIFSAGLHILPFGGMYDSQPPGTRLEHVLDLLEHMVLPVAAIFLSAFFQSVYAWRSFFLLHASEDYVEMAEAKGLSSRMIERRYILRPALPNLITSFALMLISFWQGAIVLEVFFDWPGIGKLFIEAVQRVNRPVAVSLVVAFAYLLAITVFLLDIIYALVDPRVKVGSGGQTVRAAFTKRKRSFRFWPLRKPLRRRASGETRMGPRPQDVGWRVPRAVIGSQVLDQVLGSFQVVEDVQADWLVEPGRGRKLVVDRLYPELGMAVRFTNARDAADEVYAQACRRAGIALVELDPDRPVSLRTLGEMGMALSAAARRVAQGRGARQVKLALLSRIASAKAVCRQILDVPDVPSRQVGLRRLWKHPGNLKPMLREISRYPSAIVGLAIIAILIGISIYAVIAIPYDEAIGRWRGEGNVWYQNPTKALPEWVNFFRKDDLPRTIIMNSRDSAGVVSKSTSLVSEGVTEIALSFPFDFPYGAFPQELVVHFEAQYDEKMPLLSLTWLTPDGREIDMGSFSITPSYAYRLSQDGRLQRKLDAQRLEQALFADPNVEKPVPLRGAYELQVSGFVFEENADLDAEFILYGQVYGLAGTDHRRRDVMLALLWGAPVALAFGLLAAVGTSISTMVIAAVGVWFGGWVDNLIQRITEVNMILPVIPFSIMIYLAYSKSVWVILGVVVLLSIFGGAIKNYRAIFLQVKEAPYIEAAQAYGASDRRIIFRYLIPRIIAVLIPQLVILVPSYVFLEATLAFLGVSDPVLPTWGKLVSEGLSHGLYTGAYHMVLVPVCILMLTGLAFVMVGIALERIFNPRLREM